MTLGNGGIGEAIGFNPADGLLYHASGRPGSAPIWESIDAAALTIVASGPMTGDLGDSTTGMVFQPATGRFLTCDPFGSLLDTTLAGVATYSGVSTTSRGLKGLAFAGGAFYGANGFDWRLGKLNLSGAPISSVTVTLDGTPVNITPVNMNGLATHPVTGELWGIFGEPDQPQSVGIVDPVTGVASSVGALTDDFEDIAFVPVPLPDTDGDGVPDSFDNCNYAPNGDQLDSGGIATSEADGIGDACQCGDVSGNGIVTGQDANAIRRHSLGLEPNPLFAVPGNCDVTGNGRCNGQDANAVQRVALGRTTPLFGQNCHNAVGIPVPPGL